MNNNNIKILFITEKLKINFINVLIIYTSSYGLFIINLVGLVVIGYSVMIFNTCKIKFSAAIIHFFMNRSNYCFNLYRKFILKISPCPIFRTYLYIKFYHFFTSFLELIIFISYLIVRFKNSKFLNSGSYFGSDFGSKSKPPQLIVQILNSKLSRLLTFSSRVSVELSKPPQLIVRFTPFKFLIFGNDSGNHFGNASIPLQLIVQILNSKFLNSGSYFGSDFGSKSKPLYLILQIFKPKFLIFGNDFGNDFGNETFYKKDKISSWKAKMEWTTLRLKWNGLIAYLHNP